MFRNLIEQWTRKLTGPHRKRHRQARRANFHRRLSRGLRLESLEDRNLLAALTINQSDEIAVTEGGGLTFTVTLDDAVQGGFTVDVTLADVTATGGAAPLVYPKDYDNVVAQLNFDGTAGETRQFTVATLDDAVVEGTETFTVSLIASNALVDDSDTATGTITDNDRATLHVANATVTDGDEGTTTLSFPVTLSAAVDVDVSVDYITQDGTASAADGDYVAVTAPATFTMMAGETSGTINIVVNGDTKAEPDETLSLLLSNLQASGRYATPEWTQLGQDIDGEAAFDLSGWSVSLSRDGTTLVTGATGNDSQVGHARVYRFDGSNWSQLGQKIAGEAALDEFGAAVSLGGDGNTLAVGASGNDGGSGQAQVYRFDGINWTQLGQDIGGETAGVRPGTSVSVSDDGNTLVIGAPFNSGNGAHAGRARVLRLDGSNWTQLGQDLNGEAAFDEFGGSVSLGGDGNTLAIGASFNGGNGRDSGQTRIYRIDGTNWTQLRPNIDGEAAGDQSGRSVSLSGDGNTLVIGAPNNDGNGTNSGHIRVYRFDGTDWTQLGQDIDGEAAFDEFGWSVSLSGDGNILVIAAPFNDGNGTNSGHARVYRFDGSNWTQLGQDIDGEAEFDASGWSVSLSGDGNTIAIGAPRNDGNGTNSGHARVYRLQAVATGTITTDDSAVTVADVMVAEGGGLTFTVRLDNAVQGGFTVDVTLADVTATGGAAPLVYPEDYDTVVAQLNFDGTAGETRQFTVATVDDAVVEGTETFTVSLSASNALVDDSDTATGTIVDNDRATLSVGNATVVEGDGGTTMLSFPVTLSAAVDVDVSVDYITQDGTASASDGDYVAVTTPASFTINAGDTSGTITITVNGDKTVESDETLSLLLSNLQTGGRDVKLAQWTQLGQDIDGTTGWSVSLSSNGDTLVTGAPGSVAGGNSDLGQTRVYRFDGTNWNQLGREIDGEALRDGSGWSVSMSGDGNTLVIGAPFNHGNNIRAGHARVYRFDGTNWNQLGQNIDGEAARDQSGHSASLSDDGNTLAIGAAGIVGSGNSAGRTRVYRFDGVNWIKLGTDIDGKAGSDRSGWSVSLSGDGDTIVVGAPNDDGNGGDSGRTRVFRFDGVDWSQLGQDIDGEAAFDRSGYSVSLSSDGKTLVIGAPFNDVNGTDSGKARAYRFDGARWTQLGQDIDGEAASDRSGFSVSLSGDGNTLAIGAPRSHNFAGQARVYHFDGANWNQLGHDIDGEAAGDQSGWSVSLSGDGSTLVIGAPFNDNRTGSGHARVYRLRGAATGTIIDNDLLLVEFNQSTGVDLESSGRNLPQLLVTGTIQAGHSVTIDVAVVGGTAVGGGVDYTDPTTVTIPAGTYNATAVAIPGLSVTDETLIESDETIELKLLTGSQIQVGDANGDGITQDSTRYTIQDDELPNIRTFVELNNASILTIRDVVPGGKDDQLELTIAGDRLVITDRNNLIGNFADNTTGTVVEIPLAAILGIEIDLLEGDDQLSIDFSNAPLGLNLSLTINGGGGHDTVTFTGATVLDSGELRTNDDIEDIFVNAPITMARGTIALNAAQSLEVNADVSLGTGAFQLTVGRDVFGNCSLIQAGTADVHVVAGTGIAGVRFETTGHVTLHGGSGGIVGCTGEIAVTAQTLTLMTDTSVGTALLIAGQLTAKAPLLTSVNAVQGTVGGLGVFLLNDRPLSHNVELVAAAPLGIKDICPGADCLSTQGEGSPFQNTVNRFDVNNDRSVSPLDLLAVVNHLNSVVAGVQSEAPSDNQARSYLDVNGDRAVSALDALMIINYLNARIATLAEGEWTATGDKLVSDYHAELLLHRDWLLASSVQDHRTLQGERNEIPTRWRPGEGTDRTGIVKDPAHLAIRRDGPLLPGDDASEEWESLLAAIAEDAAAALSTQN